MNPQVGGGGGGAHYLEQNLVQMLWMQRLVTFLILDVGKGALDEEPPPPPPPICIGE